MGKPKLRSSMRALHQAFINLRPTRPKTMTWVCVQQTKTHSFRDVYKSFNSLRDSASSVSTSSFNSYTCSDLYSFNDQETDHQLEGGVPKRSSRMLSMSPPHDEEEECSSSAPSFFCMLTINEPEDSSAIQADLALKSFISSKRFFFSPCTTRSLMEESNPLLEATEARFCRQGDEEEGFEIEETWELGLASSGGEMEEEDKDDEDGDEDEETMMKSRLCKASVKMAMTSENPYEDFRASMEEMVKAHGLREWSSLQELLHCYLRLNDKTTHNLIIRAFVDLLVYLVGAQEANFNGIKDTCSLSPLLLPLSLD